MKNALWLFCLCSCVLEAQTQFNNFETNFNLDIQFDTLNMDSVWQIGPPQKTFFNTAMSPPNILITDTVNTYSTNLSSSFVIEINELSIDFFPYIQLEWKQKIDVEEGVDGGIVEASYDGGITWQNILSDTIYRPAIVGNYEWATLSNGQAGFTGTLDWFWIGVCWGTPIGQHPTGVNNILMRFTMHSDSVDTFQEGWMIDDLYLATGVIGTATSINNVESIYTYPNPVQDNLIIDIQDIPPGIAQLQIVNTAGQVLDNFEIEINVMEQHQISVAHLPKGLYFLNLQTEDKRFQQKFVKLE